ncbi:hypothetical protein CEB3_c31330 [Peptococcaceae bacterium CEB3]|nr:hypothetical protein CEB3_c31330 [Peptococcaceae bacterium CEB3]
MIFGRPLTIAATPEPVKSIYERPWSAWADQAGNYANFMTWRKDFPYG